MHFLWHSRRAVCDGRMIKNKRMESVGFSLNSFSHFEVYDKKLGAVSNSMPLPHSMLLNVRCDTGKRHDFLWLPVS